MRSKYTVNLKTIVEENRLKILHKSKRYEEALLTTADVNRPAMQLTGFYNYFDPGGCRSSAASRANTSTRSRPRIATRPMTASWPTIWPA